jgi:DNA invertase Pin-like site-specific DNA recombinase
MAWYESLEEKGFTLWDIVKEHKRNLTKEDALREERKLIDELNPRFNLPNGKKLLKLDENSLESARSLRKEGIPWSEIAKIVGVSTMTVWRACNGQTKNLR